jgi:hypothetical protein
MKSLLIYFWTIFLQLTPPSVVKFFSKLNDNKLVSIFITPLIAFLVTHEILFYTLLLFILIDWGTGVEKDLFKKDIKFKFFKLSTWKNFRAITSEGIRKSFNKVKDYLLLVAVVFFLEFNVIGKTLIEYNDTTFTLTSIFLALLSVVEVYSIFENKEATGTTNYFKFILNFLPDKIKQYFLNKDN